MSFIQVEINTSEGQLAEEAKAKLVELVEASGVTGYELAEADLETILIDVLSSMAITAAQIAAVVPAAIFRAFGTQLVKLPFNEGAAATATTEWKISPEAVIRHIPAGTTIEAGGLGFEVETETEVPASASSVKPQVVAVERGAEYNGVTGVAQQTNPIDWVTEVQIIGETSNGENEESDEAYLERLASSLALQAPRPITAGNFAAFLLDAPTAVAGVKVGRATSIDGYNGETHEPEALVTSGSAKLKEVTSYTGVTVGTEVVGTGIPKGTTVTSVSSGEITAKELTMSAAATSSPAKGKVKMVGSYENGRYVTTFVTNSKGEALSGTAMGKLEAYLGEYREINFRAKVQAPTFNKVYLKVAVKVLPEYTAETVKGSVETALKGFLSPEKWGNPSGTAGTWLNYSNGVKLYGTIRYNQIVGAIEGVPGVAYVLAGASGLEVGLEEGAKGTADLSMVGAAPLPEVAHLEVAVS